MHEGYNSKACHQIILTAHLQSPNARLHSMILTMCVVHVRFAGLKGGILPAQDHTANGLCTGSLVQEQQAGNLTSKLRPKKSVMMGSLHGSAQTCQLKL